MRNSVQLYTHRANRRGDERGEPKEDKERLNCDHGYVYITAHAYKQRLQLGGILRAEHNVLKGGKKCLMLYPSKVIELFVSNQNATILAVTRPIDHFSSQENRCIYVEAGCGE